MATGRSAPTSIDEYIAAASPDVRTSLRKIRATIRRAAPEAQEAISYQMPAFTLNGALVYFAAFKNHIGLYPPVTGDADLVNAVASYAGPKGNLKFPLDQPIPYGLIDRIVRRRVQQNLAKAGAKAKTGKTWRTGKSEKTGMANGALVESKLRALGNPRRAALMQRYFKTGPGQYGEGDRFLGLSVPQIRGLARTCRDLPLDAIESLLESRWHEARLLALIVMANAYPRATDAERRRLYALYLRRTDRINNWDLVDASAPQIVGAHLFERSRAPLRRLARSTNLWERRIAIVATAWFIRHDQFDDTLTIATTLLHDPHDLIHKAGGWMLREVGKRDERVLRRFLDRHAGTMTRTMLRYALERFAPPVRAQYMAAPRAAPSPAARGMRRRPAIPRLS